MFKNKTSIDWTLSLKNSKEFIGGAGFWRLIKEHYRAGLGYQIIPKFWRKGFVEEACRAVISFGFEKMRLHSIEANVNPANIPSLKLLEKLGFVQEAYFKENFYFNGKFIDIAIFSLLISKWN
jgi:ribosomal-protein-alanine N-acetyltransferase